MIRHLSNLNELVVYAALSTGAAFFVRSHPSFYFPVLMLRLAILAYALYVVANIQANKPFAYCLMAALLLGWLGGNWDYLELQLQHNQAEFIATASLLLAGVIAALAVVLLRGKNG
jgi:CDP-diglyceride synthetase